MDALNALAYALLEKDNTRALALSREAARLAALANYPLGLAWGLCRTAGCQAALGQHVAAFADAKQALDIFTKLCDTGGEAVARQVIGHGYFYRNQFRKALVYLEQSRSLHRALGNDRAWLIVQDAIGTIQICLGHYDNALALFTESHDSARKLDMPLVQLVARNKLGHIEQRRGRHAQALKQFRAAHTLAQRENFPIWAADCLIQIGRVQLEAGHHRQARNYFYRAIRHAGAEGKLQIHADGWRGIADCAVAMKDWLTALGACDTLLKLGGVGEVNCKLYAQICLSRLAHARSQAAEALKHARMALAQLRDSEPPLEDRLAVQECLAAACAASRDKPGAARHGKLRDALRKQLAGRNS